MESVHETTFGVERSPVAQPFLAARVNQVPQPGAAPSGFEGAGF